MQELSTKFIDQLHDLQITRAQEKFGICPKYNEAMQEEPEKCCCIKEPINSETNHVQQNTMVRKARCFEKVYKNSRKID